MADRPMNTYHISQEMNSAWKSAPDKMRDLLHRDNGFPAKQVAAVVEMINAEATHLPRVKEVLRKIRKIVSRGIGLMITGPKGAGKTSIACMAAIEAAKYSVESHFILAADAVRVMRGFTRDPLEDIIRRVHVLVVDDVTEKLIDAPELETLIRDRTSNDLSTIITTNIAPTAFKQKNAMLWDLIAENCLQIEVDARSRLRGVAQMPEDDSD